MATDPAAGRLWQLPTFLVGLAALFALYHAGDRLRPSTTERYERALQALRPADDLEHYRRGPGYHDDLMDDLRAMFGRTGDEPLPDLAAFPQTCLRHDRIDSTLDTLQLETERGEYLCNDFQRRTRGRFHGDLG